MNNKDLELICLTAIDWICIIGYMVAHYICLGLSYACFGLEEFIGWAYTNILIGGTMILVYMDRYVNAKRAARWKAPLIITKESQERWK